MKAMPREGLRHLDGDTVVSPGSPEAMLRAAGAVVRAVNAVAAGEANNAFCAVRPPGHHAESDKPRGFCLVNNADIRLTQESASNSKPGDKDSMKTRTLREKRR